MKSLLFTLLLCVTTLFANAQCSVTANFTASAEAKSWTNYLDVLYTNTSTISNMPAGARKEAFITVPHLPWAVFVMKNDTIHAWTPSCSGPGTATLVVNIVDTNTSAILCTDTVTQSFTMTCPPCHVSAASTLGSNGAVTFTVTNPAGTPGMTYNWDFGDGTTATGNVVTHTYTTNGYKFAKVKANSTSAGCIDSTYNSIQITNVLQNTIGGDVIGDTLLDTFKVWLIQFDSATNNLYAVDSTVTYSGSPMYGAYEFNNKPAGVYLTKAAILNGPSSGMGYVPTYHDTSLYWHQATLINHNGGYNANKYIILRKGMVTSGPGFVDGNVSQGANKGTGNGIEGMLIFLRDKNANLVSSTFTDANGNYSFSNIAVGAYSVYPEHGGYNTTPANVLLTSFQTSANNIGFERSEKYKSIKPVVTGITNLVTDKNFEVYPNPTNGKVFINWPASSSGEASVTISNIIGSKVLHSEVDIENGQSALNISHLQAGHYYITIDNGQTKETQKLVIER